MKTSQISIPTVRNLREAREACLEFDAVITAGPHANEVSDFNHPIHKTIQFGDTISIENNGPTFENVIELVEFGAGVPKLLVHCHAGISRSTAIAWGVAIKNGYDPVDAFLSLKRIHPYERGLFGYDKRPFAPNTLIVEHLDRYFDFGTRLTDIRNSRTGW